MATQKQKIWLRNIVAKLSSKLGIKYALALCVPFVLGISTFCLALYLQPAPALTQGQTANSATDKKVTHQPAAKRSEVTQTSPVTVAPKAAAPPVSVQSPTPVRKTIRVGTTKTEPVVTPAPTSKVSGLTPTTPAPQPSGSQTTTGYTSTNWSGYLATGASFTAVSGSWTATAATGNGSSVSADSTWIGIGGVTSGDLIQVGTQNTISANGQIISTSAFYELLPDAAQTVQGMAVSQGDSMTASITEVSGGQWTISITDKTKGETSTFSVSYSSSLSSAEWIEEDPSYAFGSLVPFDHFNRASFTNGAAITNGRSIDIAASTAQPVTMVNTSGQSIAVPSAIGGDGASFTVTP